MTQGLRNDGFQSTLREDGPVGGKLQVVTCKSGRVDPWRVLNYSDGLRVNALGNENPRVDAFFEQRG